MRLNCKNYQIAQYSHPGLIDMGAPVKVRFKVRDSEGQVGPVKAGSREPIQMGIWSGDVKTNCHALFQTQWANKGL